MAAMPCGCCLPSAFAMYFRPDGSARYAPVWTLSCRLKRFASRCSAYSIHVLSSTPGAAVFLSPRKPAGRTAMLTRCRERCQLVLSVPGDGFSYAGTAMEISRFPCKRLLRMPGSTTTRARHVSCDIDTGRVAFCGTQKSAPRTCLTPLNTSPSLSPVNASRLPSRDNPCITQGRYGLLHLHRDGLPPSTFCRPPDAPVHSTKSRHFRKLNSTNLKHRI